MGFLMAAAIVVGLRVFLSERHNVIINTQKAIALRTYRGLVEAGQEPRTREMILLQSVNTIFSIQPSGYVKQIVEHKELPVSVPGTFGVIDDAR
jgi:hypothetical protein